MEFLRLIESIRAPFLDTIFGIITRLGEETVAVVIICAIFWCINKRAAYGIGVAFFFSGLTVQGLKICLRIDRPWIADPTLRPVPSALTAATGYSFPSGHTQSASALFGSLGVWIKQKPIKALCFLIVALVAFSRIYLGVHTPLDVIASLLISFALIWLTTKIFAADKADKKREFIISMAMALFAAAVGVISITLYASKAIEHSYAADSLKAVGAGIGFAAGMFIERAYIGFSVKTKSILWQIIKFVLGFAGVLAIKEGLKLIIGTTLAADISRYFLMTAWVTVGFPLIIKRFFSVFDDRA